MKKLLFLAGFLISFSLQAQNYELIKTLNTLDKSEAKKFSDMIADNSATIWVYLYEKSNDKSLSEWYIDASTTKDKMELIKQGKALIEPGQCLVIHYTLVADKYRFKEVTARYEDLLPIWQNVFKHDATKYNVPEKIDFRELDQVASGISYKFDSNGKYWTLSNWTYLK